MFLAVYYFANRQVFGRMVATDRVVASLVTLGSVGVVVALGLVIGFLYTQGHRLISWHFLTQDQHAVTQTAPASAGGISHAIIGTLEQVGLAVVIGAPAGVATAVFLNEVGGRITAAIRIVITAMSAVPSIVAGLFIYVLLITEFHYGFRGFAGSLALAILLLPNITRTTEEVLKVVHGSLREASMALGAPEWRTVWSVVLPTARTGIATAVLLGIARIVGETAPLLVTVSSSAYMNWPTRSGTRKRRSRPSSGSSTNCPCRRTSSGLSPPASSSSASSSSCSSSPDWSPRSGPGRSIGMVDEVQATPVGGIVSIDRPLLRHGHALARACSRGCRALPRRAGGLWRLACLRARRRGRLGLVQRPPRARAGAPRHGTAPR